MNRQARRQSWSEAGFGHMSTYCKQNILGSGTYSVVYKGTSKLTNKPVALKEIHLVKDEGAPFTAIREVSLLKKLKHNNIITLHDVIYTKTLLTLVFEYVEQDLYKYIQHCDYNVPIQNVPPLLFQLLRALNYCHSKTILHRDIKPQNILLNSNGELKLADFGLARAKSVPTKTFSDEVVSLWYRPPDVLLGNTNYGTSIDIWGVGCIFFELSTGHILFKGLDHKSQLLSISEFRGLPINDSIWPGLIGDEELRLLLFESKSATGKELSLLAPRLNSDGIDLLDKFLKCEPCERISANDAMQHDYFKKTFPEQIYQLDDMDSIFSVQSIVFRPIEKELEDFKINSFKDHTNSKYHHKETPVNHHIKKPNP